MRKDLERARLAAQSGMDRAQGATETRHPKWVSLAVARLRKFARAKRKEERFTIEKARAELAKKLPPPHDERTWGAVTIAAIKAGVIEPTGTYAPAVSSNGSPKREYRMGARA